MATRSKNERLDPLYREISDFLRDLRVASGITQKELSVKLGQRPGYIAAIEANSRGLGLFAFVDIIVALGGDPMEQISVFHQRAQEKGLLGLPDSQKEWGP